MLAPSSSDPVEFIVVGVEPCGLRYVSSHSMTEAAADKLARAMVEDGNLASSGVCRLLRGYEGVRVDAVEVAGEALHGDNWRPVQAGEREGS